MNRFLALALIFSLFACGEDEQVEGKKITENKGELVSKYSRSDEGIKDIIKQAEGLENTNVKNDVDPTGVPQTTMTFDKMEHDFGKVKPLSVSKTKFKVTNTGTEPLIIENVNASCGCTTPEKPDEPIAPGKSDYITVQFKPKETQLGDQNKTVNVKANTTPPMTVLKIKALVEK